MGMLTAGQVVERNTKDAEKVLGLVVKALKSGGQRAVNPAVWTEDNRMFYLSVDTNAGKGSEVTFRELQDKSKYLSLIEVGYVEGVFDWASDTYIKPYIWAKFSNQP